MPYTKEQQREYRKKRYHSDPEYRARHLKNCKDAYRQKNAEIIQLRSILTAISEHIAQGSNRGPPMAESMDPPPQPKPI